MTKIVLFSFFILYLLVCVSPVSSQELSDYNIVWDSQSKNSSESMPCGGGDIGLNVWVENGDLFFYVAKSGAFDGNNSMLKLGRVRVRLSPNPFARGGTFRQELKLEKGFVRIYGKKEGIESTIDVWVDVFRSAIHVEVKSNKALSVEAFYESWRAEDHPLNLKEREGHQCYGFDHAPFSVITKKDSIGFSNDQILWNHRNTEDPIFDETIKLQALEEVKDEIWNPVINRTFGGLMTGGNMVAAGTGSGKYASTEFKFWKIKSKKAVKSQDITIYTHLAQTDTYGEWEDGLMELVEDSENNKKRARQDTEKWWAEFWNRSHILIQGNKNDEGWRIARNYQLLRYQMGCNAFGDHPTKFNGGLFTFDPGYVNKRFDFTPDFRKWGGASATSQNQRLVYWPMLKNGDFDLMKSQFDFYLRTLKTAELRSKVYWGHKGACFTEQMENFGLPVANNYSFNRPEDYDKGILYAKWIEYQWDTVLEFCLMMLDYHQFNGTDVSSSIPLIESCLTFFDEHYRYYARLRTVQTFDQNGHYVFYPGTATETYKMATNSVTTTCGLTTVINRLLALPDGVLNKKNRKRWEEMLTHIPPIPFRIKEGKKVIAPAERWERINNTEFPQLYPVFPFGVYGIGKPGFDVAIDTWKVGHDRPGQKNGKNCWNQSAIFCARLGLTEEAKYNVALKLEDATSRFPSFWGQGDWTPDHNWGGVGMIALQEMIMQTDEKRILLTPAWPKDWNASFKLHAPFNTTVEADVVKGEIKNLKVTPASRKEDVIFCQ